MIEYLYSNMKSIDVQREYMNMAKVGITHYIVDYEPTPAIPQLLKLVNIKCYYRIKIFPQEAENFDFIKFNKEVENAKKMGFDGIAIDAEAYSNSCVWTHKGARIFGKTLSKTISGWGFKYITVFPENLGGEKYSHYDSFLKGLFGNEDIKRFDLLMERSYNQGEFYNILVFYLVQQVKWSRYRNVRIFPGIWPDCPDKDDPTKPGLSDWEKAQQMDITRMIGKRFYYSETTDFMVGR